MKADAATPPRGLFLGLILLEAGLVGFAMSLVALMLGFHSNVAVTTGSAGAVSFGIGAWTGPEPLRGFRKTLARQGAEALTALAGMLAGSRRAHLREAWVADQYDPETGELWPAGRLLRLAAGDVAAACRCRLDDMSVLGWRPVEALLGSWHGSNMAVLLPVTIAVGLILPREGFYGLIANAENLGVIAAAPYAAIKGLRKYRQIDTPKRPDKMTESAGGSKR